MASLRRRFSVAVGVVTLSHRGSQASRAALSTWLGLSGIGACRGSVGWVSVVWVRLRQSVR